MIPRRPRPVSVAEVAELHLSLSGDGVADWHPLTPRGGWTLDAAEDAALDHAADDARLAARAYNVLVRAVGLGRLDAIDRLRGTDRARTIRDGSAVTTF